MLRDASVVIVRRKGARFFSKLTELPNAKRTGIVANPKVAITNAPCVNDVVAAALTAKK